MYGGTTQVPGADGTSQDGLASWYDPPWSGLTAASPCAARSARRSPSPTWRPGARVIVVIDDRGPFAPGPHHRPLARGLRRPRPARRAASSTSAQLVATGRTAAAAPALGAGAIRELAAPPRHPAHEGARSALPDRPQPGARDRGRRRRRARRSGRRGRRRARFAHAGARRRPARRGAGDRVRPGADPRARRGDGRRRRRRGAPRRRDAARLGGRARRRGRGSSARTSRTTSPCPSVMAVLERRADGRRAWS